MNARRVTLSVLAILLLLAPPAQLAGRGAPPAPPDTIQPVRLTEVTFDDAFWMPRLETNRTVTIPFAMKQNQETGRIKNFELAAHVAEGAFCTRYGFDDSDVYKVLEGASYSLAAHPDPQLDAAVDQVIAKIAAAQEKDGYLYTARTIDPGKTIEMAGKERWSNEQDSHELYNLGHLYEAAVAHFQATGKRTLLNVAVKSADLVQKTFGPNGRKEVPGHQEIEIGLVKLSRATGERRYAELAKFFLDQRGNAAGHKLYGDYAQDQMPVVDQREAVGHAVRAAYMYTGMADVALLTGTTLYDAALDAIWNDVVGKKLYLTGGIGSAGGWEGFGPAYELGNASAYAETCASIANALWNYRMFLLHGDARYMDVFERVVYNGVLSGIALTGDKFFYPNPLASFGQHQRSPWFQCACCPSNAPRFLASLGGYAYAAANDGVFVNLFVQGRARVKTDKGIVELEQETAYPWHGGVRLHVKATPRGDWALRVRVPGWARSQPVPSDLYRYANGTPDEPWTIAVNDETVPAPLVKGYATISRPWKAGDVVTLMLPMPARRVLAHANVKADAGRVAIERGPLVYCAEWPDNDGHVHNLVLEDAARLVAEPRPEVLNGITAITADATGYRMQNGKPVASRAKLTLIPYYAWAHRGPGEMAVWLARQPDKARPVAETTLASASKATASGGTGLKAINDQLEPENSNDHAVPYFHWWPKKGTTEWVQYDLAAPATVSELSLYWFDDTGVGECRVPAAWKAFYRVNGAWVPLETRDAYGVEKDKYNVVRVTPVKTDGVRIEVTLPPTFSAGIQEWRLR
ncbi:MAG: glycoside hydrolase family 127 protein [Bacteroidales bacterium]